VCVADRDSGCKGFGVLGAFFPQFFEVAEDALEIRNATDEYKPFPRHAVECIVENVDGITDLVERAFVKSNGEF
ncbi:MAG: hypothetical protein WB973_10445, partial [Thermoanaerobaculia bacterium]